MFKTKKGAEYLKPSIAYADQHYKIQPFDRLELSVYANNGELLIDPNYQLRKDLGQIREMNSPGYIVDVDGNLILPMVGKIYSKDLTNFQLDSILNIQYALFYQQPFVKTKVISNRVVVLGGAGNGEGQVIPLTDDDLSLIEILALAGGLPNDAKATNIRLIRGDLSNPEVFLINLKTIEGMQQATLNVQPNDIIYIEPVRKILVETSKDIAPVAALFTSMVTLLVLIINVTKDN